MPAKRFTQSATPRDTECSPLLSKTGPALGRRPFLLGAVSQGLLTCPLLAPLAPSLVSGCARNARRGGRGFGFDVRKYGAVGDGKTDSTKPIRNAIATAAAAGGGTVYFPAGRFLTGPIVLKSNITLYLGTGATLSFSQNFEDYLPMVPTRWEGTEVITFSPQFYGNNLNNVAIVGRGTIDGQGKPWWDFYKRLRAVRDATGTYPIDSVWQREFLQKNRNTELPDDPERVKMGFLRPPMFQLRESNHLTIDGVTIKNAPFWTLNPVYCNDVSVTEVRIINPEDGPNTDGVNAESCTNVRISGCYIDVGDDCITIKSGRDAEARRRNRPAENYTITNCTMRRGHGGVVIGSEMSGSVRNIAISNCVFDDTDRGIRLKSTRGRGGVVERVRVSNIVMRGIREEAIVLNMYYTEAPAEPPSERTPQFRNIHLSDISGTGKKAVKMLGLPEQPLFDVSLSNVNMVAEEGLTVTDARQVRLHSVRVDTQSGPAISAERTERLDLFDVGTLSPHDDAPAVVLSDVQTAHVHGCMAAANTNVFLEVQGAQSKDILVSDNHFSSAKTPVAIGAGASVSAVSGIEPTLAPASPETEQPAPDPLDKAPASDPPDEPPA